MKSLRNILFLFFALAVAGCTSGNLATKETAGTLVGAGLGGLLGSQFGEGSGKLAATAAGTLLGGALGNAAGRSLDRADALYEARASHRALESAPTGTAVPWRNPDTGTSGWVEPTATYQSDTGAYCREYRHVITIKGRREEAFGRACRRPDGTWQIVA